MVSLYKHRAPSTTSLSDDGDDIDEEVPQFAFYPDHHPVPAEWAFKRDSRTAQAPALHSSISTVPLEIMIQIFKHIHSSRDLLSTLRVSRTWCQCAVELLWHKPSFPKYDTIHKMASLLRRDDLTFTYSHFIRRLNFLNHGSDLTDDLFSVFSICDRLERLTLIGCKNITGEVLAQVLPNFPNLVAIDLTGVVNTSSEALIGLAAVATRLQGINLSGCGKVTDSGIVALAKFCPLLRRVKLSGLSLLTEESVSALAQGCPMLLEIDLNHCELVTDISVRLIWTHLNHMRDMRLSHCSLLMDSSFPAPVRAETHADGINPFANSNAKKSDELPPLIVYRNFENLRMLDLTACGLITDDAVEGIVSRAPRIRNLVLSKCVLLTDKAVESICKLGRHLHYLHLGHASKITDFSVRLLARSCTRIRYIDFANCVLLTDMSVFELSALPKLRRIGLVRVNQLTDEAIYALAERHATLERIHLSYCDQISVMAIHFLLLKLHKLTHLSLTGVPAFRQTELQNFCREAPKDFNTAQRLAFCVFSGKGVSQLRAYLTELFDRITEMNNTDDTEYEEDDFDVEGYQDDDTPEVENLVGDFDGHPPQQITFNPNITTYRGRFADQSLIPQRRHSEFLFARELRTDITPTTSRQNEMEFISNTQGFNTVLNSQNSSASPNEGPSRLPASGRSGRVAEVLPIIERSTSQSADAQSEEVIVPRNDNGSGFFRTYQERPANDWSPWGNGALTPDLNYAEIGHGRIAHSSRARPRPQHAERVRPSTSRVSPPREPQSNSSLTNSESEDDLPKSALNEHATPIALPLVNKFVYHEPLPVEYRETEIAVVEDIRGRREQPGSQLRTEPSHSSEPRARSVKRSIRNTFHAAEHYASSLFGRSSGDVRTETSGSGSGVGGSHGARTR